MLLLWVLFRYAVFYIFYFFFFKQKTAYEMRISDWSSDVCSSDLFARQRTAFEQVVEPRDGAERQAGALAGLDHAPHGRGIDRRHRDHDQLGRDLGGDLVDVLDPAEHRQALQIASAQLGSVVEEAGRLVGTGAAQVAHQRLAGLPGAQDQHPDRGLVGADRKSTRLNSSP